jgi:hypothetical protein
METNTKNNRLLYLYWGVVTLLLIGELALVLWVDVNYTIPFSGWYFVASAAIVALFSVLSIKAILLKTDATAMFLMWVIALMSSWIGTLLFDWCFRWLRPYLELQNGALLDFYIATMLAQLVVVVFASVARYE